MARHHTPAPTATAADSERGGFTLLEVLIALVILTVGVLGLGATTVHVVRRATISDLVSERVTARRAVLETVQGQEFDAVGTGTDSLGRFVVSWSVAREEPSLKELSVVTVGPGSASGNGLAAGTIRPDVADTITYRIVR